MTKGKKYQTENETTFQTQKAVGNIYVNTEINSRPDSREVTETYEAVDISCTQNTAESSKPLSKESLGQHSRDSQPLMPVAIVRSIRCLQVMCVALLVAVIIMAATLGSVMSDQKARIESTEGHSELLKSEVEHKGYDLLHLQSQITQIDSDLKVLATVFQQMNDTIASNKADNIATNEDQSTNITQLKARLNGVSETLQRHNSRITAIEGSSSGESMVGFTARGRRSYLNGALIYSYILSEVGGGFNASTGVFTCPVAGLYLVSMTLQAESTGRINCFLYKNGLNTNLEIDIDGEGKREEPASQTAVLKLRQGDTLYIGSCPVYVGYESTFTVVLIQADIQN